MRTISTTPKKLNRWVRLGIATITSTALVGGTLVAAPAHPLLPAAQVASAQEQNAEAIAEAEAQVLDLALLRQYVEPASEDAFLEVLEAIRAEAQFPGDVENEADIDATVLEGIDLNIGGLDISLLELLGIEGNLGALGAYASTPAGNISYAAAGLLNDGGSINLGAHDGTSGVQTVLDLTTLLEGRGVNAITNGIVDELSLRLGAVSASAERNGNEVTSEYALANVGLTLDSPLVGDLVNALAGSEGDFDDPDQVGLAGQIDGLVNGLEDDPSLLSNIDGLLGSVFDLLRTLSLGLVDIETDLNLETNLQGVLDGLLGEVIESESGLVAVDLSTGQVQVNLDALGSLSVADPNTNLLSEEAVQEISRDLDSLLNGLLDNVRETITDGLLETSVTVGIDASALGIPLADITLSGSLNEFLAADPDVIGFDLLGANLPTLEGLLLGVLSPLGETLETTINGVVDPLLNEVLGELGLVDEVVAPLVGGVSNLLSDSGTLSLTLNHQPNSQILGEISRDDLARPNAATAPISNADEPFTVTGLRVNVLDGLVDLPLARATVDADAEWGEDGGDNGDGDNGDDDIDSPDIAPIEDQEGVVGEMIDPVAVEVTGEDVTIGVDNLPEGLEYNPETGLIEGTPAEGTVGTHTVTVTATNEGGSDSEAFIFTVTDGEDDGNGDGDVDAPVIAPIDNQEGTVGEEVEPIEIDVTGEDVDVEIEGLPEGVEYNPGTRVIEGTPVEGTEGTHTVTVIATNEGGSDAEAFIFLVTDDGDGGDDTNPGDGSTPGSSGGGDGNGSSDLFPGSSDNGDNNNGDGGNGSSDALMKCVSSPATGLAALLSVLGVTAAVGGPVVDPIVRALGEQFSQQVAMLTGSTPENNPEWVNQINKGLADAANALDSRVIATSLFGAGVLAVLLGSDVCGEEKEGLSSQLSS